MLGVSVRTKASIPAKRKRRSRPAARDAMEYLIEFKGNDSERWDGRSIAVEVDWVEELYGKDCLWPGQIIKLPWEDKKWRAVIRKIPG